MKISAKRMPTRFRLSAPNAVTHYDFRLSAIAFAKPTNEAVLPFFGLPDNGQLTKSLTGHINHVGHRSLPCMKLQCSTLMALFNASALMATNPMAQKRAECRLFFA